MLLFLHSSSLPAGLIKSEQGNNRTRKQLTTTINPCININMAPTKRTRPNSKRGGTAPRKQLAITRPLVSPPHDASRNPTASIAQEPSLSAKSAATRIPPTCSSASDHAAASAYHGCRGRCQLWWWRQWWWRDGVLDNGRTQRRGALTRG